MSLYPSPDLYPSPALYPEPSFQEPTEPPGPAAPPTVMAWRAQGLLTYLRINPESDRLLDALTFGLLDPATRLSLIAHGDLDDTIRAWQALTDPQACDLWALPYAAQWTGGNLPARKAGESDTDYLTRARLEAIHPHGMRRGSGESLTIAAQAFLIGTRTVTVTERPSGDPWTVTLHVKSEEATDHAGLEAAVNDPGVIYAGGKATVIYGDVPLFSEATRTFAQVADGVTAANVTLADVT